MSVARRTATTADVVDDATTPNNDEDGNNASTNTDPSEQKPLLKKLQRRGSGHGTKEECVKETCTVTKASKSQDKKSGRRGTYHGLSSPRGKSVMAMSVALAIHLGGYELARAAVMALFTSDGLGFGKGVQDNGGDQIDEANTEGKVEGGLSALPMAVGCVSPFSVALLWFYAKTLDFGGPAYALRTHTLVCAVTQMVAGWILGALDQFLKASAKDGSDTTAVHLETSSGIKLVSQPLLFLLFVAQNAYVQLLYAQHWAFISSVLTAEEGTKVFAPIAGLGSIGSTLAAGLVSVLVEKGGLMGLLYVAGASYVASAFMANIAFGLARRHGFEPIGGRHEENPCKVKNIDSKTNEEVNESESPSSPTACCKKGGLFQQAYYLFKRVPVLEALFFEVVVSQCLSSLVNFIYLYKLKATIIDDSQRAGWSGNFYAWINGVSGIFQFFIIPVLLKYCEAHRIWIAMPTIMLCCTLYQFATHESSGLFGASASFFAIKTMEYSLRGAANEMLYVNLDFESRYLGKKIISLIAGKFGKSAMAVALSLVMVMYEDRQNMMWYLLAAALFFTQIWLLSSIRLHSLIASEKINK